MVNKLNNSEVQDIVVSMLRDISSFTEEKQLHLFLLGGTLLGSVREGHMIPWDDDLDVGLPRAEYDWLMEHYTPSNNRFKLLSEDDPDNFLPYMRLVDTKTMATSEHYEQRHGVFIDIFPIDKVNKSDWQLDFFYLRLKVLKIYKNIVRSTGTYPENTKLKWAKETIRKYGPKLSPHLVASTQSKFARAFASKTKNATKAGALNGYYGKKELFPISVWENVEQVTFEGAHVWQTKEFDAALTQMYGDWRVPREDSRNHGKYYWK